MSSVLIKSFVMDMLDVHNEGTRGGIRRIEFSLNGAKYSFPASSIGTNIPGAPLYIEIPGSKLEGSRVIASAFNTDLPVDGSAQYGWLSDSGAFDGQPFRLIAVFDTPIEVDEIIYNAIHDWGTSAWLGYGLKNVILGYSEDDLTSGLGGSYTELPVDPPDSLPGYVEIFNGEVRQHVQENVRDDQVFSLSVPTDIEVAAVIDIVGGFNIDADNHIELTSAIKLFGGFTVDADRNVELDAVLSLIGGFDLANTKIINSEMKAALNITGGFGVDVYCICELKAVMRLVGGFVIDVPHEARCSLPKFDQKRWC